MSLLRRDIREPRAMFSSSSWSSAWWSPFPSSSFAMSSPSFSAAMRKNFIVKARNRRFWFFLETICPILFVVLMVVPSVLIQEKTVQSQFFISRPLANVAWGMTRGFESMDGGKYRIAYSPSENEEVRKVAMKAARRLVCENQPITFGAVVSVNAKYALKSNSPEEGMSAIPNLVQITVELKVQTAFQFSTLTCQFLGI